MEFKKYRKRGVTLMHKFESGMLYPKELWDSISISPEDRKNGSPKDGDMIARNPNNPNDMWLVSKEYFEENYEAV